MVTPGGESLPPKPSLFCLPPELRIRIWEMAVQDAVADRIIRVAIYNLLAYTTHTCYAVEGRFCGRHGSCSRYTDGSTMEPHRTTKCMADGYFAVTDKFPEPEESDALGRIGAICCESRDIVTSMYPKTLKVYRGQWHPGVESRLVRCSPTTDVLLVTAVPDLSIAHTRESYLIDMDSRRSIFPLNDGLFAGFRDIVSSFQHVALYYVGSHMYHRTPVENSDWPLPATTVASRDLFNCTDWVALLAFFGSLKHLYMWPDPDYWPHVHDSLTRIDDVERIVNGEPEVEGLFLDAFSFIFDYNSTLTDAANHYVETDEHWVVKPQVLFRIGCYGSSSWLERR